MQTTINQFVAQKKENSQLRPSTLVAALALLFLAAFTPSAFAQCGTGLLGHSEAAPSFGQSFAVPPAALASQTGKKPAGTTSLPSIVGLWNVQFISNNQVVDVAFDGWHEDGTEVLNDFTNPINGNVCLGVWEQISPRAFKLKHPSWYFDNSGNLLGTVIIHETVRLSADGNSYTGTYLDDVYDASGDLLARYSGKIAATRITVD